MQEINPINYKIRLEPDLKDFKFSGSTEILLESPNPIDELTLNALELAVWNCRVRGNDKFLSCPFYVNPEREEIRISFPNEMSGIITLRIDYMGMIKDKMAGFYRSKYLYGDEPRYIAVTQFEESDARRAFPCLDHPAKKASFDIEMIIDGELVAISNGPIIEEREAANGKKLVRFQQTPKMSTYLLFFAVGEFEFIEDPKDVLVRVATIKGRKKYGEFGLDFGRKSLEFCEDYYGIDFPLPKLDLIAVPDFAFGAMENWGAITFRENLLLHYPDITSKEGEERICEVISHEMAHQWFGNLVTPSDWKYLWLNESFATYFGFGIVGHYRPEWHIWDRFLYAQTNTALDRDALVETFPIEIPGGEHVVINTATAPIIYNKGGSILRQIEGYIGKDTFKKGLRHYLKAYEYACASSRNLWESFEEISRRPITKIMRSWIEQEGFPIITVKRDGNRLLLTQKRFTYLPNKSEQKWLVPITVRLFYDNGDSKTISLLLEDIPVSVDIEKNVIAYKVNDGQTGFYRVMYDDKAALNELGRRVLSKELPNVDRWGIQNDLYALVKGCEVSLDGYLDFLSNYTHEDGFLPLISISSNLFHAFLVMKEAKKEKVAGLGKSMLENVLAKIGHDPDSGERHSTSILRDQIIFQAVLYGSQTIQRLVLDKFKSLMQGEPIHPDIMRSIMQVGALNGDSNVFDWFEERLNSCDSEHERMNILMALGRFNNTELIERALQYILDKVPDRNKFIPLASMASNPNATPFMWDWYTSHLEELEQFHPLHYERVIAAIVPVSGLGREDEVTAFFDDYTKEAKRTEDAIKLSLERLKINSRMREYNGP